MNKTKVFLATLLAAGAILLSSDSVFAAVRCETQYGGNEVCVTTGELQIDKEILDPRYAGAYKDNLYLTDYLFKTGDYVTFKLTVKNVGDDTLNNVRITDNLPSFLFFTGETPHEFTIDHLNPDESESFEVKARVVAESQLEADRICGVNTAEVWADGDQHDKDTSQVCATKKVLGVSVLPETGDNTPLIIFGASLAIAMLGLGLIKVGRKIA
ncbi:hypothetical protein COS55_01205 [Candidatus Shapirobacteria bacterium CG03_land_8_20_14_0_80_40_19]|uniref:DUF11 domain-containing protein n=2 Tax=Candidatus Shapironibacteriota TaxID=1752721 RepID=A0A2M7BEV7_9BACT|nr:MAG: hypothetical protein COS55_01205 [Candidatus Shapirobacteria bacterium CG03_land_8_20_14_0_80_40_19]PJC29039.1 MAG: hypothetical protein CO053_01410 [Candidatus Shapirobacteria bacterium CG_4_9_14_0_2_um_filter_40_11]